MTQFLARHHLHTYIVTYSYLPMGEAHPRGSNVNKWFSWTPCTSFLLPSMPGSSLFRWRWVACKHCTFHMPFLIHLFVFLFLFIIFTFLVTLVDRYLLFKDLCLRERNMLPSLLSHNTYCFKWLNNNLTIPSLLYTSWLMVLQKQSHTSQALTHSPIATYPVLHL